MTGGSGPEAGAGPEGRVAADLRLPPPRSLYVHFPFCPHRCHYCDYAARGSARPPVEAWLDAVTAEMERRCRRPEWDGRPRLETIYVGGGTPSLLGGAGLEALAERLRRGFRWRRGEVEWTVEANPESLDPETVRRWRRAGVSRVTVGVQSFREEALDWLGRLHGPADALRALVIARDAGIDAVNAALMYGLPGEAEGPGAAGDAELLAGEGVEHVTLYGLEAAAGTHLGRWAEGGLVSMPEAGEEGEAYLEVSRLLREAGYRHYEVSNLALPGRESRHDRAYWDGTPYMGLGPSAHSFLPPLRLWNERRWAAYRNEVRQRHAPVADVERRGGEERDLERIWLSMRRRSGFSPDDRLLERVEEAAGPELREWEDRGWIRRDGGGISPTPEGWLHLDDLVSTLAARIER